MNAIVSAVVSTFLTLIFQPLIARAQEEDVREPLPSIPIIKVELVEPSSEALPPPPQPPQPRTTTTTTATTTTTTTTVIAKDPPVFEEGVKAKGSVVTINAKAKGANGSLAHLKISILDAEHYWPFGRADTIVGPGGREEDLFRFLDSSGLRTRIGKATDIIAIGMSSCEFDRATEEPRADDRAKQLISWVRRTTLPLETQLYTVNIGQFQDPECHRKSPYQTRDQRNAILVSIVYKENIQNQRELGLLVREHLMHEDRLRLDIGRYSKPEFILHRRD